MKSQIRLLIILIMLGTVLGAMALASTQYSADEVKKAIEAIGEVSYSDESRLLIDAAVEALNQAGANLSLEGRVDNLDQLEAAKVEYVRLAIKRLYISIRDRQPQDTIREYLADAEAAYSYYLTEADSGKVRNFADLVNAREKYGNKMPQTAAPTLQTAPEQEVTIELCGI